MIEFTDTVTSIRLGILDQETGFSILRTYSLGEKIIENWYDHKFVDNLIKDSKRDLSKYDRICLNGSGRLLQNPSKYIYNTCLAEAMQKILEYAGKNVQVEEIMDFLRVNLGFIEIGNSKYVEKHDNKQFSPTALRNILDYFKVNGYIKLIIFASYKGIYIHAKSNNRDFISIKSRTDNEKYLGTITLVSTVNEFRNDYSVDDMVNGGHYEAWLGDDSSLIHGFNAFYQDRAKASQYGIYYFGVVNEVSQDDELIMAGVSVEEIRESLQMEIKKLQIEVEELRKNLK